MTEPMHDISVEGFIESFDRRYPTFILKTLLCDRTTGRNIIWADNEYEALGDGYMGDDEMTVEKITGMNSGVIKPRIAKEQEKQSQRTKSRAEVFTPSWLCNQMNNDLTRLGSAGAMSSTPRSLRMMAPIHGRRLVIQSNFQSQRDTAGAHTWRLRGSRSRVARRRLCARATTP